MKILVSDLKILNKEQKGRETFNIDDNEIVVEPHVLYTCFDPGTNQLVKVRDFKGDLDFEVGDNVEHEFNVYLKKLDNK